MSVKCYSGQFLFSFLRPSTGFSASLGISQTRLRWTIPSILFSAQSFCTRRSDRFHFFAASCTVIYSNMANPPCRFSLHYMRSTEQYQRHKCEYFPEKCLKYTGYNENGTKFASNANLHKFANFHSFVTISETAKMLVGGIPPNPWDRHLWWRLRVPLERWKHQSTWLPKMKKLYVNDFSNT